MHWPLPAYVCAGVVFSALTLGIPALVQAAPDAARGEQVYVRCMACHARAFDRVGPHHCGLLGRRAGSVAGFSYSTAMKKSRITWNDNTLNRFLINPLKFMPGNAMTYDGVADLKDRVDLIAYLKHANETAECAK